LEGIYPGFFDMVLYKRGYVIFKSSMRIQEGKLYKLNLDLVPDEKPKAAKIKKDAQWNNNYLWFQRGLLGVSDLSDGYKIENTQSLQFELVDNSLIAKTDDPLKVENQALGLTMNVYLQQFEGGVESSKSQSLISYQVKSSDDYIQQSAWERNRLKSYWGSSRHVFQTLVAGTSEQEGFIFYDENKKKLSPSDLVSAGSFPGYHRISLGKPIEVVFQLESGSSGLVGSQNGQTSTLTPLESIEVNNFGILFSAKSVAFTGSIAHSGLAESLPIDYLPTSSIENEKLDWKNFSLLREKAYLHTDRDYYYPRESVWFKAYMGYSMPIMRDTLSATLYVELISPQKERIDSRTYRIKGGVAWGDFKLRDSLPAGQYYLRAYTNWMRNYGDSTLFVKSIPILSLNENIEPAKEENATQPTAIKVTTVKESFSAREKIDLKVQVVDERGVPVKADLSVSVTDAVTSVLLSGNSIIDPASLFISDMGDKNQYFDQISHYMERGLSFRGVVKDGKGNPTPGKLEIIQGNMDNLISMETDEQGEFLVTGVNFTDSLVFAFKPVNKKGKPLERVDLLPREVPPLNFNVNPLALTYRKEDALQRIQNTYRPDEDVTMLKEVEVKSTRLAKDAPNEPVRIYGTPDYVVKGDNIRSTAVGTNVLVGLQGKVPGLQVIESMDGGGLPTIKVKIRGGTQSLAGNTDPLILVDGVPFPDAQSISALDPSMIDRVEVITRATPQYGSRGSNGVIAIYTKSGFTAGSERNYLSYKIPGYDTPRAFFSPTYGDDNNSSNPDFRTTIFWKPDVRTDEKGNASVSFYSADLATRYRIVVEGVTEKGTPLRAVSYITVE
jgi:TonB-dependent Receptor Plug Domain